MARYRLIRSVVAGATGRAGEALTRQLLLSPLCEEVQTVGRRETRAFDGLSAASAKLKQHVGDFSVERCDIEPSRLMGADAAFCLIGAPSGWSNEANVASVERDAVLRFAELCAAAGIPHFSMLSSAWASPQSKMAFARIQAETIEAVSKIDEFRRVSLFLPSAAVGQDGALLSSIETPPLPARAAWWGVPLAAQFMSNRYRPMALEDIALAMRLNAELCTASERVEKLEFRDMMMIIGKENEI
eukprot:TRINITY_DN71942_c0_g1_i1.p1 TRINITY_DN71942_c0_g1~~TRINITY_DN71942_c0_g1_i1.p1  ORF type:complete len:244 (-),score=34.39 TRINITY_DN71942_c0_g1_i1:142-873(-)